MEELHRFNPQQPKNANASQSNQSLRNYGKKILSFNIASKVSSNRPIISNVYSQNQKPVSQRSEVKRVKFTLPIEQIMEKTYTQNHYDQLQETNLILNKPKNIQKQHEKNIFEKKGSIDDTIYMKTNRRLPKRAFSVMSREQIQAKSIPLNQVKQLEKSKVQRKSQKPSSVKFNPRLFVPLSNRKLPQVFKSKLFQKNIQKLINQQVQQSLPKIRAICQKQVLMKQNQISLKEQVQRFKKRLVLQSKLMWKLNCLTD